MGLYNQFLRMSDGRLFAFHLPVRLRFSFENLDSKILCDKRLGAVLPDYKIIFMNPLKNTSSKIFPKMRFALRIK